ncbi:hypothetical protein KRX57_05080 [Weeksellaceae bacterium TAE3-ERU29]|nr:hypothetical protein [Weeksellaceae bacterium TAE3-ERU29]
MNYNYSVIIRTLGTAGQKYEKLLESLIKQTIKPTEILVVLPKGYKKPKEQIGIEKFIFSEKGMVQQRIMGIKKSNTDFLLIVDDDVKFGESFVENLFITKQKYNADCICPKMIEKTENNFSLRNRFKSFLANLIMAFTGGAYRSKKKSKYKIKICSTGGFIVNTRESNESTIYTQSYNGACFFINRSSAIRLKYEEELWLDNVKYAWPDDQVFFYKLFLQGNKIIYNKSLSYYHLDAGASLTGNNLSKKINQTFSISCNSTIFWHRFIYLPEKNKLKRVWKISCLIYRIINTTLFTLFRNAFSKTNRKIISAHIKGYIQAYIYISSNRYKDIPKIKFNSKI